MLLEIQKLPDQGLLQQAMQQLLVHHDALRLRFEKTAAGWSQRCVAPDGLNPLEWVKLADTNPDQQLSVIQEIAAKSHERLNLTEGPILRAVFFERGPGQSHFLLIIIHHLAVDGVSWRVLLDDLEALCARAASLPPKTTSFKQWAEQLTAVAQTEVATSEISYWTSLADASCSELPVDKREGDNTIASARTVSVSLNTAETRALLQDVPASYRTQINEVLLTALGRTLGAWTQSGTVLLDLEGHGREEILEGVDLSRTVGWFTTIFPVVLRIDQFADSPASLKSVKEQLRAIPNRGIGYGLLRYLNGDESMRQQLTRGPQAQVRFNYMGQMDRVIPRNEFFSVSSHSSGPAQSPVETRNYLLNIIGAVRNGELRIDWTYSENFHDRETIEQLARTYIQELQTLITGSPAQDASYIPSDFPDAKLSEEDLSTVLAKLRG
jgi:non-ribosomal peptide synthase protein (TIGR01720 family)